MELILTERIIKLGQLGDLVNVKSGYARNYLIPQGKAIRASKENLKKFEEERTHREADNLQTKNEALNLAKKIEGLSIVVIRSASETGQLYGSVNDKDITKHVTESGFIINHKQVVLEKTLKEIGLTKVQIKLHPEVFVDVNLNIARTSEEASAQAKIGTAVIDKEINDKDLVTSSEIHENMGKNNNDTNSVSKELN